MILLMLHAAALPPGQIIDNVTTAADPEQRYALYLPARYDASRGWPVIFAFDPGAGWLGKPGGFKRQWQPL